MTSYARQILSLIQHQSKHRKTASNQACVSAACPVWCGYSRVSGDILVTKAEVCR
jgi:hypothetical protein